MDDKVEQKFPRMNGSQMRRKINIPDFDLDELKKHSHLVSPRTPTSQTIVTKSSSARFNCLCSPTTHVGSFRCRHHRNSALHRGGSVGSNLSELAGKSEGTTTPSKLSSLLD
ncbi:putative Serine-rich protein-related [Quillaja saponaria]|uniref:Serine-rich protein-related n=1 Tax=Quillaja saponaria TaxID=32244 RepID=A0AAD7LSU0_QUISA|nr:putative Serine-rich protein-related [Quillaja saponaria]